MARLERKREREKIKISIFECVLATNFKKFKVVSSLYKYIRTHRHLHSRSLLLFFFFFLQIIILEVFKTLFSLYIILQLQKFKTQKRNLFLLLYHIFYTNGTGFIQT